MRHDIISDVLSIIQNSETIGKNSCVVPSSKFAKEVLNVVQRAGYIGAIEPSGDGLSIELLSKINKTKAVRPRFAVRLNEFEKFEKRYLPAKGIGILIMSTSKGLMTQVEAAAAKIGGRVVAYVY